MVIKSHKLKILIVDDSSIWRTFLIGQLYTAGLTLVYVAYDGVQAVFKAQTLKPDLILMDVALPHKNGIEAAAEIRKSVPDARIVFLSGNNDPDIQRAALDAGGCDFVLKSLSGRHLVDAIKRAIPCAHCNTETA
jgi:CheY-like chemotaxis protein